MLGGEKGSVAFHGDHRPASIYVDGQVVSEPAESTQEGTMLTFDRTYNDRAEVSVFGESVQDTLTGKNLINVDGAMRQGSETDRYYIYAARSNGFFKTDFKLEVGKTYTFGAYIESDVDGWFLTVGAGTWNSFNVDILTKNNVSNGWNTVTFTPSEANISKYDVFVVRPVRYAAPTTFNWKVAKMMLVEGAVDLTEDDYEPYCGGIPAPNPSYPMPIESRASACVKTSNADGSKTSTTDLTALLDGRELRSLPDGTSDELQVRDNGDGTGDVVLVERVGNMDMGSMMWEKYADVTTRKVYYAKANGMVPANANGMCDGYMCQSWISLNEIQHGRFQNHPTLSFSYFCNNNAETVDDFKASVAGMHALFPLATQTETVIGTIPMPETYYDTTHVWEANGADISAMVRIMP